MQSTTIYQRSVHLFALAILCIIAFSFTSLGLDKYEIYLNKELLLKQDVNQPLSLRKMQLHRAKESDQLFILYRHCHEPNVGTGRTILIKDEKGNTLKKWDFPNVAGADPRMKIAVKELQELEKKNPSRNLVMYYSSSELSKGETLAFISFSS